jgi:hypothetical protein
MSRTREISIAASVFVVSKVAFHGYLALQSLHSRFAVAFSVFQFIVTAAAISLIISVERWSRPKSHEKMALLPQMLVLAASPAVGNFISDLIAMSLVPRVPILPVGDIAWFAVALIVTLATCVIAVLRTGEPRPGQG